MDVEEKPVKPTVDRRVKIKTMDSQVFELVVPSSILVSDFRKHVQEISGIPPDRQRLICKAKLLVDEKRLHDYIDEDDQFIHLLKITAPEQGAPQQPQRRTEQDFNNTLGRGQPAPGQIPFNPFGNLGSLFGNLNLGGIPMGPGTNVIHVSTVTHPGGVTTQTQHLGPHPHQVPQPAPQQPQPAPQGPRLVAANQRVNHLVGVGPQGIEINLRHLDQPQQEGNESTNFILPHVQNLVSEIYGPNSLENFPLLPRDSQQQNSLTVLGNYMHSLNLQISLLMPAIQRFSEVSQRESVLADPIERQRLMVMGNQLGRAFERLAACMRPCGQVLRQLRVLNQAGQFGITTPQNRDRMNSNVSTNSQPAQENTTSRPGAQQQPQSQQRAPQNSSQIPRAQPSGPNPEVPINPFGNLAQLFGGMNIGGPQGQGGQGAQPDLGGMINNLLRQLGEGDNDPANPLANIGNILNGVLGQQQPQNHPQAPHQQAPPQQPQARENLNPGQNPGPQGQPTFNFTTRQDGDVQGFSVTTSPNVLNTRLRDFSVAVNDQRRADEKDFGDVILGCFEAQEVIALITGNTTVIDGKHAEIRADVEAFITTCGSMENAEKKYVDSTVSLFLDGLRNNPNVYEGFEPETVTKEIARKHFPGFIDCIRRDNYTPDRPFSQVELAHKGVPHSIKEIFW